MPSCAPVERTRFFHAFAAPTAGFYVSDHRKLPWGVWTEPIDELCVHRVAER